MTALDNFFRPRGVAFVGATEDESKLGGRRFRSLVEQGFAGSIYPVHPRATSLRGLPAFRSVRDVPDPIDLAVIVVPTAATTETVADCAARGVPAVAVITAGFGEVDQRGRELEQAMAATLRRAGSRMLGPNCAGLFDAASKLNLGGAAVPEGGIALVSQSGNLLLDFNQHARARGQGFSRQVTIGNAVDLGATELIADCLADPNTAVILAYLEGWRAGEGRDLFDLARASDGGKPIVLLKPGRSVVGRRAALTHTGAMAGEERVVDAALRQCGIVRADTVESAWDLAAALYQGNLLKGRNITIVSDGGGHATVLADALGLEGLAMPPLPATTREKLAQMLPPRSALDNPIDFAGVAESEPEVVPRVIECCLAAPEIDAVVLAGHFGGYHKIGGAPLLAREMAAAAEIAALSKRSVRMLAVHSIHGEERTGPLEVLRDAGIPVLRAPEAVAHLLAGLCQAGRVKDGKRPTIKRLSTPDPTGINTILSEASHNGTKALLEPEARRLLAAYGLDVPEFVIVGDAEACAQAAARLGPAALKLIAPGLVHRSDVGGVLLGVADAPTARTGFATLLGRCPPGQRAAARVLVTPMIAPGLEVICGAVRDPQFGPVVMFGAGGIAAEALDDVAVRLAPIGLDEADAMLREIRTHELLGGYRGRPAVDRRAVCEVLVRLGEIMLDCPAIAEIDLNPVILNERGAQVADARALLV